MKSKFVPCTNCPFYWLNALVAFHKGRPQSGEEFG